MRLMRKGKSVFLSTTIMLLFTGCEMIMPAESTAFDTENILEETEDILDEIERHNEVMEEQVKKQTKLLEEISKTLKTK